MGPADKETTYGLTHRVSAAEDNKRGVLPPRVGQRVLLSPVGKPCHKDPKISRNISAFCGILSLRTLVARGLIRASRAILVALMLAEQFHIRYTAARKTSRLISVALFSGDVNAGRIRLNIRRM